MKKLLLVKSLVVTFSCAIASMQVAAQSRLITGKVTASDDGSSLPGVSVVVKGTTIGTTTDATGKYSISAEPSATLVFSFIGFAIQEAPVGNRTSVDIKLLPDTKQLGEIVVTALGLKEDKDKFASSVSTVKGPAIAKSGETSLLTGLSGKASGVLITRNGGDPGAGAYIQIRGQNTINGSAQPLFIVDGIPVSNSFDNTAAAGNAIVQQSRISDINPEDIESVEVLKGASAAALWGTRAANGVVIITTKKGKDTGGRVNISLKSTVSIDEVNKIHKLQRTYGQGSNGIYNQGDRTSWGDKIAARTGGEDTYVTGPGQFYAPDENDGFTKSPKYDLYNGYLTLADGTIKYVIPRGRTFDANGNRLDEHGGKHSRNTYDHTKDPFRTGYFFDNTLSITGGNAKTNYSVSYGNLSQQGVVKSFSDYKRNTARVNVSSQFTDWLRASSSVGYTNSKSTRIQQGDNLDGILLGGLRTSPDFDNSEYTGTYTDTSGTTYPNRHVSYRNPLGASTNPRYSNPLWNINNNKNTTNVDRVMGSVEIGIDPVNWLNITGRAGVDNFIDDRVERFPIYSASFNSGFLSKYIITEKQFNTDLFARATKKLGTGFDATLLVGVNYNSRLRSWLYSQITDFIVPSAPDILTNAQNTNLQASNYTSLMRTYAYYAQAELQGYDQFFLTLTGRSESASTFGAKANSSFFFPSAALAWQFTKIAALRENPVLSFGKLRVNWGQVGIQPQPYKNFTTFSPASYSDSYASSLKSKSSLYGGGFTRDNTAGNEFLKPERKTETEIGTDLRFFGDRINLSVTYYSNQTKDVILDINTPSETGFTNTSKNAATLSNKGIEIELGGEIIHKGDFSWSIAANYSQNRNKVVSLAGLTVYSLPGSYGGSSLIPGQPFGVFYGTDFLHDDKGKYILDANGFVQGGTESEVIGNPNPKWRGGLTNTFSYKGLSLAVLFDAVHGNQFYNGTRGALYTFGTHADNGHEVVSDVDLKTVDGKTITAGTPFRGAIKDFGGGPVALTQAWFQDRGTSFTSASAKQFIEDASVVRLREVSLNYSLRSEGFRKATKLSSIDFSLTGRNLLLWTPFTGVDPEINITGAGIVRGEDWFSNPNTRSFLFSVKINY
ncbi:SusC/RagA family TonB-linked outer membrane protein [Cytophagaceae bacterium DM2B3-1]|uniref:SusC/RagA family TonB-linked outer membrane protein n=1 Tax=Xanthocytophaga flava TaxID=3048013 RepID=A0ABT7CKV1_9BACT|nr:SusC/RagA family TonB-linked outer membrane protein [Xanthocytophaga flavus]MDJ1494323.1 SusC/RagA family TonB-linked outer membrane protein [Xanthocytophaga flavus]